MNVTTYRFLVTVTTPGGLLPHLKAHAAKSDEAHELAETIATALQEEITDMVAVRPIEYQIFEVEDIHETPYAEQVIHGS